MLLLATILLPWAGAALIAACHRRPRLRESVGMINTLVLFAAVCAVVNDNGWTISSTQVLFELDDTLNFALHAEPLGLLFALVSSSLWIITHIYCIGYMHANREKHLTGFFVCFALAIGAVMGVAFSANLLTLFVFYEVLTLVTYFLVAHKRDDKARAGARVYLRVLLFTSVGLLFPAIVLTYTLAGEGEFRLGGIMPAELAEQGAWWLPLLLGMFMYGIGKAALMPAHRWLPSAMVAPTPVSALLHAVAVVKAGVFCVCKVVIYIFGIDFLQRSQASQWLVVVAGVSIVLSSCIALRCDNLKSRLAYSTVSQLAYVLFACALATPLAVMAAMLQILMHAWAKITLFFVAGNIYTAHHYTEISQCDGLAAKMPFSYAAWLVGSLSIMGFPLLGGMWVKWNLFQGIAQTGQTAWYLVIIVGALLSIAYLLPVFVRGMAGVGTAGETAGARAPQRAEAPALCVLAVILTSIGCVILFFLAPEVAQRLQPVLQ